MNELFGAYVRRLLKLRFLKAALKVCLLARVGDDRPRFRFHSHAWGQESKLAFASDSITAANPPSSADGHQEYDWFSIPGLSQNDQFFGFIRSQSETFRRIRSSETVLRMRHSEPVARTAVSVALTLPTSPSMMFAAAEVAEINHNGDNQNHTLFQQTKTTKLLAGGSEVLPRVDILSVLQGQASARTVREENSVGCLLVIVFLAFPRIALALLFLFSNYLERPYHGLLWPVLSKNFTLFLVEYRDRASATNGGFTVRWDNKG